MVIWVIRPFLYSSSVYFCHLFLISSASVRSIPFLSFIVPIFARNIPLVSNFLDEISSLSHSVVFLYFFGLIAVEGFLISHCYSLELCIQMSTSFLFSFPIVYLLFPAICKAPETTILPFCNVFSWGWFWSWPSVQCHKLSSIVLQALSDLIPWIYLSLPLHNHKGFDLDHTRMV